MRDHFGRPAGLHLDLTGLECPIESVQDLHAHAACRNLDDGFTPRMEVMRLEWSFTPVEAVIGTDPAAGRRMTHALVIGHADACNAGLATRCEQPDVDLSCRPHPAARMDGQRADHATGHTDDADGRATALVADECDARSIR